MNFRIRSTDISQQLTNFQEKYRNINVSSFLIQIGNFMYITTYVFVPFVNEYTYITYMYW